MELSSQEAGEIPIPINSAYGGGGNGHGHMIHHHHHHHAAPHNHVIPASSSPPLPQNQIPSINGPISTNLEDNKSGSAGSNVKKLVKYKECLKNHAAAMGGNATDGCGEFMPSGKEGTIEALTCSACNCHRNFHRKEIEGEQQQQAISPCDFYHHHNPHHHLNSVGRKVILGHHKNILAASPESLGYPTATGTLISSRAAAGAPTPHQMIMSYNMGSLPSESDEQEDGVGGGVVMAAASTRPTAQHLVKKRFRTKFTQEQKEKMLNFAEKVGWKFQKQEESVVQQFCQEIGIKRRVLKVWMHNNKHNLAKKNNNPPSTTTA